MNKSVIAYVCYRNSDLTEGRGYQYPYAVCSSESTARRLCIGADVQGINATYNAVELVMVDGVWFGPVHIQEPNKQDTIADDALREKRKIEQRKAEALENARSLGLSDEDIAILSGAKP